VARTRGPRTCLPACLADRVNLSLALSVMRVCVCALMTQVDRRFFWNHYLVEPLVAAGVHDWVLPIMMGRTSPLRHCATSPAAG